MRQECAPQVIPLSSDTWGEEERFALLEVINSGRYTMGERTLQFERAYADYCGTKYCVAVNSGSSANLLMVAAYTLRYGPGVAIVPAVGWSTSYAPLAQYGWKLIFVDVSRDTLNIDPVQVWKAVESLDDPVVMAINLLGNPVDYWALPRKCHILEDNCESMGAEYRGKRTGALGLMASHSTYFSHHICTGEGGMVTTNDEWFYHALLSLRSHGWTRHLPERNVFNERPEAFRFILPGYNVRPTDLQAALGLAQLRKLDRFVAQRRDNAARFPLETQRETPGAKSSWYGFAVFGDNRAKVRGRFETRPVVTGNFCRQPVIRYFDHEVFGGSLPNADYIHDEGLMIGNSHEPIDWGGLTIPERNPALAGQAFHLQRGAA